MRGCSVTRFCCFSAACFIFGQAAAEESIHDTPVLTTNDVVISATRTEITLRLSAPAVTVLMREEIERSPYADGHQMDDLVRTVPRVQTARSAARAKRRNLTDRHYIAT
jgi:outer membrane cobalamin receptor